MATVTHSPLVRRQGATGVHSLNRFAFSVPDLQEAERFYAAFGLEVRRSAGRLDLHTQGHAHCWGSIFENGAPKRLQYVSFGIYQEDLDAFRARIAQAGIGCEAHPMSDGSGLWLRDPDGIATQLVVAPKVSLASKAEPTPVAAVAPGKGAAPGRSAVQRVRPRRLSHILKFSSDVPRMVRYCTEVLGLRLSDKSQDLIAFMHGVHGSDHHIIAFAKSEGPGLHHSSWDVGSIDDIGCGAEFMRGAGYRKGWGLGRHVLGSNYFHYVQDPWGSFCEYSYNIDFVPADLDWPAADHPPEDSFYVWGPDVPEDFVTNYEARGQA